MVLNTFADGQVRGEVASSSPVEFSLWPLSVKITSGCWLNSLSELVIEVKEGCILRAKGPLVKVRKVSIWLYLCDVGLDIADDMCSINDEQNPLFLEELS